MAISPDGSHFYAGGRSDDALAVLSRDEDTGTLSFVEALFDGRETALNKNIARLAEYSKKLERRITELEGK